MKTSTRTKTPTHGRLAKASYDDLGEINATKLHDFCIDHLNVIERNRQGSGARSRGSVWALAKVVRAFLLFNNWREPLAATWFWQHPYAEYSLQLHADDLRPDYNDETVRNIIKSELRRLA